MVFIMITNNYFSTVTFHHQGRRACPGESVAEWTAFIFLVNIIRSFMLAVVPGENPPMTEMHVGITSGPHPFKVAISRREIN